MDSGQHNENKVSWMIWIVGTPVIFSVGIIGNILTVIVLLKKRQNRSSTSVYLTVLALADLLILTVSLPRWWFIYLLNQDVRLISNELCKLHWFLTYLVNGVSTGVLIAVTIERIISTVKPYRAKQLCTFNIAAAVSATIIITLMIFNAHVMYGLGLFHKTATAKLTLEGNDGFDDQNDINGTATISGEHNGHLLNQSLTGCQPNDLDGGNCEAANHSLRSIVSMNVCWYSDQGYGKFYNGPFQIMIILLYNIFPEIIFLSGGVIIVRTLVLNRESIRPEGQENRYQNRRQSERDMNSKKITVTLLLVNIIFIVCTTPIFIFLLGRSVWINAKTGMTETQEIIWAIVNMMYYANHAANFILYCLSGARFRQQVLELLGCRRDSVVRVNTQLVRQVNTTSSLV